MISNAYNRDCLEAMREFPDNYFELAVVDPPYGAGFTETGGCQGWFAKYHQDSQSVNVERERERERNGSKWDRFAGGTTFTKYKLEPLQATVRPLQESGGGDSLEPEEPGQSSTGKKLSRGTWPLEKNTSTSFSASHAIRLYGAAITLIYHRRGAS